MRDGESEVEAPKQVEDAEVEHTQAPEAERAPLRSVAGNQRRADGSAAHEVVHHGGEAPPPPDAAEAAPAVPAADPDDIETTLLGDRNDAPPPRPRHVLDPKDAWFAQADAPPRWTDTWLAAIHRAGPQAARHPLDPGPRIATAYLSSWLEAMGAPAGPAAPNQTRRRARLDHIVQGEAWLAGCEDPAIASWHARVRALVQLLDDREAEVQASGHRVPTAVGCAKATDEAHPAAPAEASDANWLAWWVDALALPAATHWARPPAPAHAASPLDAWLSDPEQDRRHLAHAHAEAAMALYRQILRLRVRAAASVDVVRDAFGAQAWPRPSGFLGAIDARTSSLIAALRRVGQALHGTGPWSSDAIHAATLAVARDFERLTGEAAEAIALACRGPAPTAPQQPAAPVHPTPSTVARDAIVQLDAERPSFAEATPRILAAGEAAAAAGATGALHLLVRWCPVPSSEPR